VITPCGKWESLSLGSVVAYQILVSPSAHHCILALHSEAELVEFCKWDKHKTMNEKVTKYA